MRRRECRERLSNDIERNPISGLWLQWLDLECGCSLPQPSYLSGTVRLLLDRVRFPLQNESQREIPLRANFAPLRGVSMSSTSKTSSKTTDPSLGLTDEEILASLQKGETEMFGPLVRRYERELYGYLRRFLGNDTLAEDVFQNTFLVVFQRIAQYEVGRPVRPWLYKIATNQAIDALRRAGKHVSVSLHKGTDEHAHEARQTLAEMLAAKEHDPLQGLKDEERRELVRKGVDDLPDHLRLTVLLAYFHGLKYREIADVLGIPVGTVKSRLHLALARLHEAWRLTEALRDA